MLLVMCVHLLVFLPVVSKLITQFQENVSKPG